MADNVNDRCKDCNLSAENNYLEGEVQRINTDVRTVETRNKFSVLIGIAERTSKYSESTVGSAEWSGTKTKLKHSKHPVETNKKHIDAW